MHDDNAGAWIRSTDLEAVALQHGITPSVLRDLGQAGIFPRPQRFNQLGQRGARYRYPAHAVDQLQAIANARSWRKDMQAVRHHVWWNGFQIDWTQWQADRLAELALHVQAGEAFASLSEVERDQQIAAIAGLVPAFRADSQYAERAVTLATLFMNSTISDLTAVFADRGPREWPLQDPRELLAVLKENMALPIDGSAGDSELSVGRALAEVFGIDPAAPSAEVWPVLILYGFMPDQRSVVELMQAMTEERATHLRDAAHALQNRGRLPALDIKPELAGLVLLFLDRIPQLADLFHDDESAA